MKTYISQSPARATERNLINTVGQSKKQQFNFTDNRPVAVSQHKTLQSISQPIQMKQTIDKMVRHDLRSQLRNRFFTPATIAAYTAAHTMGTRTATFVATQRPNIAFANLGGQLLNSTAAITAWLGQGGEHIFIWNPGNLTGGINLGGANKVPHPTLRGGDPDVDFAGTFIQNPGNPLWHITNNSGHFRFNNNQAIKLGIANYVNSFFPNPIATHL